jgi:hypothetical protein
LYGGDPVEIDDWGVGPDSKNSQKYKEAKSSGRKERFIDLCPIV